MSTDQQWIIYLMDFLFLGTAAGLVMLMMLWQRGKNVKKVKDKILCEFWPKVGPRYYELLPRQTNDSEVVIKRTVDGKPKEFHYLYDDHSQTPALYPRAPFLGMKFLQVPVPMITWPEDDSDPIRPIDPYQKREKQVYSPDLIRNLNDSDAKAVIVFADQEISELQKKLADALAHNIPAVYFYIGLGLIFIAAGISAYLGFQNLGLIQKLAAMYGIA